MRRPGSNYDWWARRPDFPTIKKILEIAAASCPGGKAKANYLAQHIGILNGARPPGRASWNFIAIKGSRPASFSVELKLDEKKPIKSRVAEHAHWQVDPYDPVRGHRVHLPANLTDADLRFLKPLIDEAFEDWTGS